MRPGYYRRNGVPYGANAHMTEWFSTVSEPDGSTYLLVTKILEDPQYMNGPYADGSVQEAARRDGVESNTLFDALSRM